MTEELSLEGLTNAVSELAGAFEEFKSNQDRAYRELKSRGGVSPELTSKIDRISADMLDVQDKITKAGAAAAEAKTRAEALETASKRAGRAGTPEMEAKARAGNVEMQKAWMAARGKIGADVDFEKETDHEAWAEYTKAMPSFLRKGDKNMGPEETKTMQVGSDADGGYLVTPTISSKIISKIYETSPIRQLASVETVSSDSWECSVDNDEVDCGWVGETDVRDTETDHAQVGLARIPVHELWAMPAATQKMLEDAAIDIESWLARKVAEKMGRTENTAFTSGNGIKKPRGFLSYAAGTNWGQIEQIVSGNATSVTADGLYDLVYGLKEAYANNANFLMRRASVAAVMKLKNADGMYLWQPNFQLGGRPTLLGHSVYEAADMPAIGASALAIAFGDFKAGYQIIDRVGISVLRDPYTKKGKVLFYTRKRVGGDVVNFEAIKLQKIST